MSGTRRRYDFISFWVISTSYNQYSTGNIDDRVMLLQTSKSPMKKRQATLTKASVYFFVPTLSILKWLCSRLWPFQVFKRDDANGPSRRSDRWWPVLRPVQDREREFFGDLFGRKYDHRGGGRCQAPFQQYHRQCLRGKPSPRPSNLSIHTPMQRQHIFLLCLKSRNFPCRNFNLRLIIYIGFFVHGWIIFDWGGSGRARCWKRSGVPSAQLFTIIRTSPNR